MSPCGRVTIVGASNGTIPTTPGSHSPTYNGGQQDAYAASLDLYLRGVEAFGDPTPACRGPISANATEMPLAGAPNFAFYCSGAPPHTEGFLALGSLRQSPRRRLGVEVWIDLPTVPAWVVPVKTDADGYVEVPWPLPHVVGAGALLSVSAQFFLRTTPSCPGTGPWCASDAVRITLL